MFSGVTHLKVYMDVCCLNRPFDDQTQEKIRFETEAVISILKRCDSGQDWVLAGSDIISLEISKNNDPVKKRNALLLYGVAAEKVKYNSVIKSRAADFRKHNVKLFDSLHLASAEYANADIFLTTDDQLLKASARSDVKIPVKNPLKFYMEVLNDEKSGD